MTIVIRKSEFPTDPNDARFGQEPIYSLSLNDTHINSWGSKQTVGIVAKRLQSAMIANDRQPPIVWE